MCVVFCLFFLEGGMGVDLFCCVFCDQAKLLQFKQKYEFNQANQNGLVSRYAIRNFIHL